MSDRIRVMLHKNKMQPIIDRLKEQTECNSITHLIHCLLEYIDRHPEKTAEIKQWVKDHDYKRKNE